MKFSYSSLKLFPKNNRLLSKYFLSHTSNFLKEQMRVDLEKSKVITKGCLSCRDTCGGKKAAFKLEISKFRVYTVVIYWLNRNVKSRNQTLAQLNVSRKISHLSNFGRHQNIFFCFSITFRNKLLRFGHFCPKHFET